MALDDIFDSSERYVYAKGSALQALFRERAVVDAVSRGLQLPIARGHVGKLSDREASDALAQHIRHLSKLPPSPWHQVAHGEIAAAALLGSDLADEIKVRAFPSVPCEDDLTMPVAHYMQGFPRLLDVYAEVTVGRNRVDLVGRGRVAGWLLIAVELKNTVDDFKRGADQITTYKSYAHEVWAACTPRVAADFLDDHARGQAIQAWNPDWLENKLKSLGCGLLLVEPDGIVRIHGCDWDRSDSRCVQELVTALTGRTPLPKKQ